MDKRAPVVRPVLTGLVAGALYGVALRAWMRFVSSDPEFTWGGSLYIVGVFAILGTNAGLAVAARQQDRPRALLGVRTVGIVLSLGCFVAAGAAMLPVIAPAALARSRTDWPRWVRLGLAVAAVTAAVGLSLTVSLTGLPPGRTAVALLLYLALCIVETELVARLYAPSLPPGSLRAPVRVALVAFVLLLFAGLVAAMLGVPG